MRNIEIKDEIGIEGGHSFRQKYRLYRHFDKQQNLLYVGISLRAFQRLSEHREHSHWFSDIANVTFEPFSTKEAALAAEKQAIQSESPKFNVHYNKMLKAKVVVEDIEEDVKERPAVTKSKDQLTGVFRPTYTLDKAAEALSLSRDSLNKLIERGEISVIQTPRKIITGWQLIEFLERWEPLNVHQNPRASTAIRPQPCR